MQNNNMDYSSYYIADPYQTLPRRQRYDPKGNGMTHESAEDRIRRLEHDKESLILQVSVLNAQVEAQFEKIHDLEDILGQKHTRLETAEDMLQSELLSRTSLETHKLDLMAEISNLKLKLATSEKERKELEMKFSSSQKRIDELQSRLNDKTIEANELRLRSNKNGTIPNNNTDACGDASLGVRTLEREKTLDRLKRKHSEVERLKKAVESLMAANDEKERHIDELRKMMKKYKRLEEVILSAQGRKVLETLGYDDDRSDSSSTHHSSSSNENTVKELHHNHDLMNTSIEHRQGPIMPAPSATSTPVNSYTDAKPPVHPSSAAYTPPSVINMETPQKYPLVRSNSAEDLTPTASKTPPTIRQRPEGYAQSEAEEEMLKDTMAKEYKALANGPNGGPIDAKKKNKGFKRFFGKLRRSSSQDLDNEGLEDFKRSGFRATAGARLGWSRDIKYTDIDVPFARWDGERVALWLHSIGLSMYVGDCKRWVKNGNQLLKASPQDLEKELGIRNHFHRKKLQLHLQGIGSDSRSQMDDLDHNWVTRWLDDIGLPQYKDYFSDARIDGRMLNFLSIDDLVALKVTNALHHLSFKRGIQVLRKNDFNPIVLRRRPALDEGELRNCPKEVMLWTNHRVMEWLRTIDLSEYAPNLRGSGVHGGLMVLEPKFGADVFASILSIAPSKTLLRRHLSTHFVALIGGEMQHLKREEEGRQGFMPLTPNQKIKLKKFGLFNQHRRARSEAEVDDYVCPMEINGPVPAIHTNGGVPPSHYVNINLNRSHSQRTERTERRPAREGGAYANDLNNLTHMLSKQQFMDDVPTSNV